MPNDDNDVNTLSRSSSLLQFETLEKQCQETRSNSPSIYSQFSFDSLETSRKSNLSPDSLNSPKNISIEDETDFSKIFTACRSSDSLICNKTKCSGSDSSDSDVTLDTTRSFDNLKLWRSFDSLPTCNKNCATKEKLSVENLSEDSGYGDHLSKSTNHNQSIDNSSSFKTTVKFNMDKRRLGFSAYDGDVYQEVSWFY